MHRVFVVRSDGTWHAGEREGEGLCIFCRLTTERLSPEVAQRTLTWLQCNSEQQPLSTMQLEEKMGEFRCATMPLVVTSTVPSFGGGTSLMALILPPGPDIPSPMLHTSTQLPHTQSFVVGQTWQQPLDLGMRTSQVFLCPPPQKRRYSLLHPPPTLSHCSATLLTPSTIARTRAGEAGHVKR